MSGELYTTPNGIEILMVENRRAKKDDYSLQNPEMGVQDSVTKILDILNKPGLPWYGMEVGVEGAIWLNKNKGLPWNKESAVKKLTEFKKTVNHQNDAKRRGQNVHTAAENFAREGIHPEPTAHPDDERGYIEALCRWIDTEQPEFVRSEVVVASPTHGYAGRFDGDCILKNVGLARLDFKTSRKGTLYPEVHLQLAAYELAATECGYEHSDARIAVLLKSDGTYEQKETCANAGDFLSILDAYNAMQRLKASIKQTKADEKKAQKALDLKEAA